MDNFAFDDLSVRASLDIHPVRTRRPPRVDSAYSLMATFQQKLIGLFVFPRRFPARRRPSVTICLSLPHTGYAFCGLCHPHQRLRTMRHPPTECPRGTVPWNPRSAKRSAVQRDEDTIARLHAFKYAVTTTETETESNHGTHRHTDQTLTS